MKNDLNRKRGLKNLFQVLSGSSSFGGVILITVTIIALIAANTQLFPGLNHIWEVKGGFSIGNFKLEMTLQNWVNDALMVIFFFVVGLEIKREMTVGELSSIKKASLPILAAIGGMIFPAIIYTAINYGTESQNGWGIPIATDIAFSLGVISLLGKRVPSSIKVFLTALAIVDDIGAIIVLAIFYPTHALHPEFLLYALPVIALLITFNRLNIHNSSLYVIPGILLWYLIYQSGISATISGVMLAMFIPTKSSINEVRFYVRSKYYLEQFKSAGNAEISILANPQQLSLIHKMHSKLRRMNPLINRFEHRINPYVTFAIMPIFALANAGVVLDGVSWSNGISPLSAGIFFGLLLGKPIGITLFTFLGSKLKLAERPEGIKWKQIFATGVVAGIGFTMSIFIDSLAFSDKSLINEGKAAILVTSVIAAILGLLALSLVFDKPEKRVKYKKIRD